MEYVWNPVTFLDNIQAFMKTGGILYISFHQFYMHHNPESEDCLRYTLSGIKKLMDSAGLEIIDIKRKTMSNDNLLKLQEIFRSEGMRGLYQSGETFMQGYCITAKKI